MITMKCIYVASYFLLSPNAVTGATEVIFGGSLDKASCHRMIAEDQEYAEKNSPQFRKNITHWRCSQRCGLVRD